MNAMLRTVLSLALLLPVALCRPHHEEGHEPGFLPEISGDLNVTRTPTGASFRGMFGLVDYTGAFVYGSVFILGLVILCNVFGVSVMPHVSGAITTAANRFDLGLTDIKHGVDTVRKQIKGRGLPLDDHTLDTLTDVVLRAIDVYEQYSDDI